MGRTTTVKSNLKGLEVENDAQLLSYIINQNPELKAKIGLPEQGKSIKPLGKIILDNQRYRNMFINTVNLIGLTLIKRNVWENPWEIFANKGALRRGQQVRELIQDLAEVFDYNKAYDDKTRFLRTRVPDVYNYIHDLNFQKVYENTVNESLLQMAFDEEGNLYDFVVDCISTLYTTYNYDKYLVDKYQICRRILDGTITPYQISDYATKTPREILAEMKGVSNRMTFMSPNYNPAGVRRATTFENQYLMIDCVREGINSTEIFATSYFKDEAMTKTNMALIDSFSEHDTERLALLLEEAYVPFTSDEINQLKTIVGLLFADDLFMDYYYALDNNDNPDGKRQTEFMNPTSLDRNVFLHAWNIISTSPFAQACVFSTEAPGVTSVTVSPSTATVSKGQSVKLSATVVTTGFANKSVSWSSSVEGITVDENGNVQIPSDAEAETVTITATSIYDNSVSGTATITIAENVTQSEQSND